jgi:hypothetical protein
MGVQRLSPFTVRKTRFPANIVVPIPESWHYTDQGVKESLYSAAGNATVREMSEEIIYTTKRSAERHRSNSCSHTRYLRALAGGGGGSSVKTIFKQSPHINHYADYYAWPVHASIAHSTAETTAVGPTQLNVAMTPPVYYGSPQADIDTAFQYLKPDLTALSVPNFFLELDDVMKLFQLWKRKLGLAKNLAGLHLNYAFGWKPFLSDIKQMVAVLTGLMDKLKAFEEQANKICKSHYFFPSETTSKSGSFIYGGSHKCNWYGKVTRTKSAGLIFRALPFQVTEPYMRMLRAYLDALGFELNPRIIWDAIPFTFVLDWFFGIGSWLDTHKYDTLEIPFVYVDCYVQYKQTVEISSNLNMWSEIPTVQTSAYLPTWITSQKYFCRVPVAPSDSVFRGLGWRLPTNRQARLLVSLGTALS